ncbi:MAG: hypothetical protein Q9195_007626 [Heterodermia aff. obscurata]
MTCRQMRDWLDPRLAARLNRLVWANPNIVQLIRPRHPENYGITQKDMLASDSLPDAEALAVRDNVFRFTEDLYACPMLTKYVKHVFIDYRKLSSTNKGFCGFEGVENVEHMEQLMRYFKLEEHEYSPEFWTSTCGLAATILLVETQSRLHYTLHLRLDANRSGFEALNIYAHGDVPGAGNQRE